MIFLLFPLALAAMIFAPIIDAAIQRRITANPPDAIATHAKTLARKRQQLVYVDDYGCAISNAWDKEKHRFIRAMLWPDLSPLERMASLDRIFSAQIEKAISQVEVKSSFSRNMQPIEYEHYCAEIMRQAGWSATVTQPSGDQGGDVIAEADGHRIVLQCKLYNHAVSNRAVQEVVAARVHYGCDAAAIVTNLSYTRSAKQLAASNQVALLHHDNLHQWAKQLLQNTAFILYQST